MPRSRRLSDPPPIIARRIGAVLCVATCVVAILAGCATTVQGRPAGGGSRPSAASGGTTSTASTASSEPAAGPATTSTASFLCPGSVVARIAKCLETALSDFWTGQLNQVVDQPIVLAPTPSQVPADCRGGLELGTAFTCQADGRLYVTSTFLTLIGDDFTGPDLGYALAGLQAHEMGHVVQFAVKQPGGEIQKPTPAQSRVFEQQADCLSGVWAFHEAQRGDLDATHFESVDYQLLSAISSNPEIQTHGTPQARRAAVARGRSAGRPQDCRLATFH